VSTAGAAQASATGDFLKQIPAFSALSEKQRDGIADVCELAPFSAGARVCRANGDWQALYIVLSGQARLVDDRVEGEPVPLDVLSQGGFFGERALFFAEPGPCSVYSLGDLTLLKLSRQSYTAFLVRNPDIQKIVSESLSEAALRSFLSGSSVFSVLEPEQLSVLVKSLKPLELKPGEFLIRENDPPRDLYIVEQGRFRVYRDAAPNEPLAVVQRGEVLGEMALMTGTRRNANVVAEAPSVVFALPGNVFSALLKREKRLAGSIEALMRPRSAEVKAPGAEELPPEIGGAAQQVLPDVLEWSEPAYPAPAKLSYRLGRFPAVRQQSVMDCGAACLSTLCRYYGKRISLNRMRELARVGRAGASMLNLLRAANKLGFETQPVLATYDHLKKNHLPALVNWNGYHWIVVYRVSDTKVTVADPGPGLVQLTKEEFLQGWTRYTLYLRPTRRFAEVEESPPTLQQFKPYMRPYKQLLWEIGAASLAIQIFALLLPMFTKFVIDDVIVKNDQRWLFSSLVGISAVVLLNLAISYSRQQLLLFVSLKVNLRLLGEFYQHVLSLPLPFFENRKVGDIVTRFEENTKITAFFTGTGIDFFIDTIAAVLYLGLMLYYNVALTVVAVFFVVLHLVNIYFLTPYLQQGFRDVFQKSAETQSHLIESLTGLRTVKILGIEHLIRWTWENLFIRSTNAYFKTLKYGIISGLASQLVNHASSVAILFYGAWKVLNNQLTVGELVAFTVLVKQMTAPATKVVKSWDTLQETLNSVERLNDVLEAHPEASAMPDPEKTVLPTLRGHIRFENVTFRYEPEGRNVLQNIDLEVRPGQKVAFVGRSGSGKSTLVKLILGFYQPNSGTILVDGFKMTDIWIPSLRRQVGVVPQESFLFRGTIRENISQAAPDAPLSEVMRAARLAAAHDFISALPAGYESELEEQASNLSGGQRQRIAIARAALQDPRVLVLDEATSALDNESERVFVSNLEEVFRGRTTFTIAHRLSTVRNADLIIVLDQGNIIERGSHEELLAQRGLYYFLSTQQLNL
jgi:ATP-binding cassette subfamily B protein